MKWLQFKWTGWNRSDLRSIPVIYRSSFYLLPLFITWWPGYIFEKEEECKLTAKRGLALAFMFGIFSLVLFVLVNFLENAGNLGGQIASWVGFLLQSFAGLIYAGYSLFLIIAAWRKKPIRYQPELLVDKLESFMDGLF